ncbi:MAG: hypothetical protein GF418_08990 [Chitinivibrionales bacterium]|nr:hypothetical protein [Chitinivibrionales bacterium]MBD3395749.1 hypothetical protein [Chitinivibrionales bacterium]
MNPLDGITLIPILHGRVAFATQVRRLCLEHRFGRIAVDVPSVFSSHLAAAVSCLPLVSAVVARQKRGPVYYVPTDPCDAAIEGIRQAQQNHVGHALVGSPWLETPQPLQPLPDEFAVNEMGFEAFCALCLHAVGNPGAGSPEDRAAQYTAYQLLQLRSSGDAVLGIIHMRRFARVVYYLGREKTHNLHFDAPPSYGIETHYVNPDHLYFALGELPFVSGKFEKERHDLFAGPVDVVSTIKDLFRETRDGYYDRSEDIVSLSPARIQAALTFLRNLTVMDRRFIPGLFDIVAAAKGVGGNTYALRVLKNAKYYPYLPFEFGEQRIAVGIDKITLPGDGAPRDAVNLFRDTAMVWRSLAIKPDPSELRKKKYRFSWSPFGMCSHVPEDRRIESFNAHVRKKAQRIMAEDFVKTERFSTSVKDGIDIRETLRNWHTGHIYVKEVPPSRGPVDTVVIIFDEDHDDRYPQQATWYAEHGEESTLTFYATNPLDDMIGPGIARSEYGGLSLLFPPRPVPDAFELTRNMGLTRLSHRLACGAMVFGKERAIAYVAARRPDVRLRMLARRHHKHLVWIPLTSFSSETLRRLRRFHVLNGKVVRSWASRFIGD